MFAGPRCPQRTAYPIRRRKSDDWRDGQEVRCRGSGAGHGLGGVGPLTLDPRPSHSVVVVGGVNIDIVATADPLRPGLSNPGRVRIGAGGAGRNVAENLARLGVATILIAAVHDDPVADAVLAQTARAGVDIAAVTRVGTRGNYYVAIGSAGRVERAVSDMSAAEALTPLDVEQHDTRIRRADAVVVDANLEPQTLARTVMLAAGRVLCLLPVSVAKAPRIQPHLGAAALLVLSAPEAEILAGRTVRAHPDAIQAGQAMRGDRAMVVVITLGERGLVWVGREVISLPGSTAQIADPSGAGDAVAAVAIYGRLAGLPDHRIARMAQAAGTMTVAVDGSTHPGLNLTALDPDGRPG